MAIEPKSSGVQDILSAASGLINPAAINKVVDNLSDPLTLSTIPVTNPTNESANNVQKAGQQPVTVPTNPPNQPPVTPTNPQVGTPVTPPAAPKVVEPIVVETPLGKKVFGEPSPQDIKIEKLEDIQKIAETYGLNLENPEKIVDFLKEYKDVKEKIVDLQNKASQLDNYNRIIDALPADVKAVLNAALIGQDYKTVVRKIVESERMDYSKPFEQHNVREIVNMFSPRKYTKAEYDELDESVRQSLEEAAKIRYETERQNYLNQIQAINQESIRRQQAFEQSVEQSLAYLKANNPGIGEAQLRRVREIMTQDLHASLFNPDQTYRIDAAEKIAMLEFGKETIQKQEQTIGDLVKKYVSQGMAKATEEILLQADKRLQSSGGDLSNEDLMKQIVERETSFLKATY